MIEPDQALVKKVGEQIRLLRSQHSPPKSQESLGFDADLTAVYIGEVERGEKRVTVAAFARIVGALDLRLSEFFAQIGE